MSCLDTQLYRSNEKRLCGLLQSYERRHLLRDGTPLVFSFLVTNRCFLKCTHCFYYETTEATGMRASPDELTLDEYRRMSNSMQWIFMALFCGGEPFLRTDLHEIIGVFRRNNRLHWADSATNGQLTAQIVQQVELICKQDKFKVFSLSFSIDGFEDVNDATRGKGTFQRSLESWKECKRLAAIYGNLQLNFSTTIHTVNQHSLAAFLRWAIDALQPNHIAILKARQSPRGGAQITNVDPVRYDEAAECCRRCDQKRQTWRREPTRMLPLPIG